MSRAVAIVCLLLIFGMSIPPVLTQATNSNSPHASPVSAYAALSSASQSSNTLASTVPATQPAQPQFSILHGQSGFWRIGQTPAGVWWFIRPTGETEFLNTVTTVQPYQAARDTAGVSFVSHDYDGGIAPTGNLDTWAQKTIVRVKDAGFKGLGAWSNPILHKYDIPMTRDLNLWTWMGHPPRLFYSADWPALCENAVKVQVVPLKDNKNLVGYYLDNELDWGDGGAGPSIYFDGLSPTDPNRQEVIRVIQTIWKTPDAFAKDWNTKLADWKDLDAMQTLPPHASDAYGRLFAAWLSHLSEDYFRLTTTLVHKYDPNHLILGVRFKGYAPTEVVRASRGFTDAVTINYYVGDGKLDSDMFRMMYQDSGQPVIISEYSFHALDGRSGNRDTVGFASQVLDQQARADGYRLFTTRLAQVPYVIGADWFQWNDEPPSGRVDGEDVNFGIVDVDDHPYELLVAAIQQTAPLLNPTHAKSDSDDQTDVWRESFANKPVMHVPYLEKPIKLDGNLSDWPTACKIPGMRHSQTIGLERSTIPIPNVYLGWRPEGLYIGWEVFDNDIQGAPAKGWWWTRDHVEFWISTRSVPSDQNTYNEFCHQFFFVPVDFPAEDGVAGVVGQWHRPGDAIKDNLIPHPDIKEGVRILTDRYVVEMLIPAKALNGWDPEHQPAMAFNIHVRNYQHALDYFWSAPKEVMTQLRPNTWGNVYLDKQGETAQSAAKPMTDTAKPLAMIEAAGTR